MKWKAVTAKDGSAEWQEASVSWGAPEYSIVFVVEQQKRCWVAFYMLDGGERGEDWGVGEYRSERLAKAACRRKAGALIRRMIRDMQA